tara:strand:- start:126 stop:257 length:132 start_codon:yes stop_codon:yes gene_type:complete
MENLMREENYVRVGLINFLFHIINFEYNIREDFYGRELHPDVE